ncbi:hypothetical protein [Microbulbifer variabilis]|uniref:hypothetical protein n=1 Tax=Microbulbifer variabilis TaxID=266805 RepID=UPI00035D4C5B|nr:hypothetical protein [Microbulbifer variabilis]
MKLFAFILGLLITQAVTAEFHTGEITGLIPYQNGTKEVLIIQMEGNPSGGCNTTARFAMDSDKVWFKTAQSVLLAALHAQSQIKVNYTASCNSQSNAWDIQYLCAGKISC